MNDLGSLILNALTTYGLSIACLVLFLGSLGLPLPCTLVVIMLGAFVRENIFNLYVTSGLALLSSVSGDLILFGIGRLGRSWVPRRIQYSDGWMNAENTFKRHAGIAIFMTRWFVTPIAFFVSLIAGNSEYFFSQFLWIDIVGELLWILLFGGLGYAFSSQSDLISEVFSSVTGFIIGLLVISLGIFAIIKFVSLRSHRISVR